MLLLDFEPSLELVLSTVFVFDDCAETTTAFGALLELDLPVDKDDDVLDLLFDLVFDPSLD